VLALDNFKTLCALKYILMHFWHPKVILLEASTHFIQNYRMLFIPLVLVTLCLQFYSIELQ